MSQHPLPPARHQPRLLIPSAQTTNQKKAKNPIPIPRSAIIGFPISNPNYKTWFKTGYTIFDEPTTVDIPELISQCEKLFDENVFPMKKLVKDIENIDNLTIKEMKIFFNDDSNLITNTFFTELNKKIQCYGYISLLYNNNDERLINSKNKLKFKILKNNEREIIALQLEDVLKLKVFKILNNI